MKDAMFARARSSVGITEGMVITKWCLEALNVVTVQKYVVRAEQERTATEAKRKRQELELLAAAKAKEAAKLREVRLPKLRSPAQRGQEDIWCGLSNMLVPSTM